MSVFHHPQVVSTVASLPDLEQLPSVVGHATPPDLLEFRLDLLQDNLAAADLAIGANHLPHLLTARRGDEGGSGDLDFAARFRLLQDRAEEAAVIDLEIRSLEEEPWQGLVETPGRTYKIVGSYHDFESTPDAALLRSVVERGIAAGVDLVKIATRLQRESDIDLLESLLADPPIPMAVMGMGPLGQASRLRLARVGSLLNYGYTAEESAPGQWQANELAARLREAR